MHKHNCRDAQRCGMCTKSLKPKRAGDSVLVWLSSAAAAACNPSLSCWIDRLFVYVELVLRQSQKPPRESLFAHIVSNCATLH
eukprot:6456748-Amphidinium_carterae.1